MNTSKNLTKSCVRYSYMYVDRAATPPSPPAFLPPCRTYLEYQSSVMCICSRHC